MTTKKMISERKIARGAENTIPLPYQPRALTINEVSESDCYTFYSFKNKRNIQLISPLDCAKSMCMEFSTNIEIFIERPCTLSITDKRIIDISFWSRTYDGQEYLYLIMPNSSTIPGYANSVKAADKDLIEVAALRQGIRIKYVFEHDLLKNSANISVYFKLLPYVNFTRRILSRSIIRGYIIEYLKTAGSGTVQQLQKYLSKFEPVHVQAVMAWMVHGGILKFIESSTLSLDTIFELVDK